MKVLFNVWCVDWENHVLFDLLLSVPLTRESLRSHRKDFQKLTPLSKGRDDFLSSTPNHRNHWRTYCHESFSASRGFNLKLHLGFIYLWKFSRFLIFRVALKKTMGPWLAAWTKNERFWENLTGKDRDFSRLNSQAMTNTYCIWNHHPSHWHILVLFGQFF